MSVDLALSRLLSFPEDPLEEVDAAVTEAVREASREVRGEVDAYYAAVAGWDPMARQQAYVDAFDFDRRASLHLTAHTHGDRRERGQRLIALKALMREAGLVYESDELPDHLAVLLELRALAPEAGRAALAELRPAIEIIRARLHDVKSPYRFVMDAVAATMPRLSRADRTTAERLAAEGPPGEMVGLEPFAPPEVMPAMEVGR